MVSTPDLCGAGAASLTNSRCSTAQQLHHHDRRLQDEQQGCCALRRALPRPACCSIQARGAAAAPCSRVRPGRAGAWVCSSTARVDLRCSIDWRWAVTAMELDHNRGAAWASQTFLFRKAVSCMHTALLRVHAAACKHFLSDTITSGMNRYCRRDVQRDTLMSKYGRASLMQH